MVPSLTHEATVHLDTIYTAILSVDHEELIASGSDEYERLKAKTKRRLEKGSDDIELHKLGAGRCVKMICILYFLFYLVDDNVPHLCVHRSSLYFPQQSSPLPH